LAAKPAFRIIHGVVLGLDGKPAAHRKVQLVGLSRGSTRPYSDLPEGRVPGWDFTTDRQGRFTVPIGDFATWDDPKNRPGWGTYALVVESSPDDAGAVSSRFFHDARQAHSLHVTNDGWGDILDLPAEGLNLTLQVKPGVTLEGTLEDAAHPGRPLAGVNVTTHNDLGSESHTGHGGEILWQSAKTDGQGRYTIRHIYPAAFTVGLETMGPEATWLKTKVDGAWVDDVRDVVTAPADVTMLDIMASKKPLYRYFGRVVDDQGQPVAGAQVAFGLSLHPEVRTFEDDHTYSFATTRADGRYQIELETPWVRGLDAEAKGYERQDLWTPSDTPTDAPGEYNFTLKKQPTVASGG
jgi:hypothetical protein